MVRKIGAITIGQSPRVDVVPEMQEVLGAGVEIIEGGALDGLTYQEILELAPVQGDYVLVTKLQDGRAVKIAERYIIGRMQAQIDRLIGLGAEVVIFLCTGEFPPFSSSRLLLFPQVILHHFVAGVAPCNKIGVISPDKAQIAQSTKRWSNGERSVAVEAASPYGAADEIWQAALILKSRGVELIVLDCIGFNKMMKEEVARLTGLPVVLPRTVAARTLAELLS